VNLRGSRCFQGSKGRDVVVGVNREGVHSDTIHGFHQKPSQLCDSLPEFARRWVALGRHFAKG
jgi:hypothetical protein